MFFNSRSLLVYRDWLSFIFLVVLSGIGLTILFSATYRPEQPCSPFFVKQIVGVISGLGLYMVMSSINYRFLLRFGYCAYWGILMLLVFTLFKGTIGMGGQRWISLFGLFKFQPSELAKIFFPAYATYSLYGDPLQEHPTLKMYCYVGAVLCVSTLLIAKQPDLGTALVILFSGLIMLWIAGLDWRFFAIGGLFVALSSPISWHLLRDYQKKRILVFLGQGDVHKERYQMEQSKIAVGSGGLYGKGLLQGTQNQLNFLPESRTDCIFSVLAEEWGLVGSVIFLVLYILFLLHLLSMIIPIADPATQLLALGLLLPIIVSALINISMVIGLLPAVGVPLPLLSYGLSNLWTTCIGLGWFESIALHRYHLHKERFRHISHV